MELDHVNFININHKTFSNNKENSRVIWSIGHKDIVTSLGAWRCMTLDWVRHDGESSRWWDRGSTGSKAQAIENFYEGRHLVAFHDLKWLILLEVF